MSTKRLHLITYIKSCDTGAFLVTGTGLYLLLPDNVNSAFTKDIYGIGISVLSIVFSVFFAALAVIMTSGDDSFVLWLEEKGHYNELIKVFKATLASLFVALVLALIMYGFTAHYVVGNEVDKVQQSKWWLIAFSCMFIYSLVAAVTSSMDAIKYAQRRATYILKKRSVDNQNEDNGT